MARRTSRYLVGLSLAVAFVPSAGHVHVQASLEAAAEGGQAPRSLLVQNLAGSRIRLMSCTQAHEVEARSNATVALEGAVTGFWVVPHGLAWTCNEGPFNLFYYVLNATGSQVVASAGWGIDQAEDHEHAEGAGSAPTSSGSSDHHHGDEEALEADAQALVSVAGVEITVPAGRQVMRCRMDACETSERTVAAGDELTLTIIGHKASVLSFYWGPDAKWHGPMKGKSYWSDCRWEHHCGHYLPNGYWTAHACQVGWHCGPSVVCPTCR